MPSPIREGARPVRIFGLTAETPRNLVDKACLPQSCLADHSNEHCHPLTSGRSAGGFELVQLLVPAHQGRIETPLCQRAHAWMRGSQEESIGTGTFCFDGCRSELFVCRLMRICPGSAASASITACASASR